MRIALFVPGGVHPGGVRDVIPALLALIERLARRHQVRVVVLGQPDAPPRYSLLGAEVHNLAVRDRRRPGPPLAAALLALRGARPDVVHGVWAGSSGLLAGLVGRLLRRPVILSIGGGECVTLPDIGYGGFTHPRDRLRTRAALRLAHVVTAGSDYMAARTPVKDVQTVPLGPNARPFEGFDPETHSQSGLRMLHVASINRVKDPHTLVSALARVVTKIPEATLDWVGADVLEGEIQARVADEGLSDHVRFHGFLPQAELRPRFDEADLYVHASRHESQCVAVMEAALAGLPVVGTRVGCVADLADSTPSAAVAVPPGRPDALAEAILALHQDRPRRQRTAEAGRRWALDHDADWTAARFEAIYDRLVS